MEQEEKLRRLTKLAFGVWNLSQQLTGRLLLYHNGRRQNDCRCNNLTAPVDVLKLACDLRKSNPRTPTENITNHRGAGSSR